MESKNEIARFVNYYIFNQLLANNTFCYLSLSRNSNTLNHLITILYKSIPFEKPDSYFFEAETSTLYIFEHFEFDCSRNNRHGSTLRRNITIVDKEINKEEISAKSDFRSTKIIEQGIGVKNGNTTTYYMGDNGDLYRNNYIENIRKIYKSHSQKSQEYVDNCMNIINTSPKNIVLTFLIEDVTMGGTYYKNKNGIGDPVNLILTKQFLEIFKKSKIDYVLFGMQQSRSLTICDKTILDDDLSIYKDLLNEEFFIIPAMPRFTFGMKMTEQ